ncbi:MAG: hypothetical protein H8E44_05030 [Planctomycetes bacterium]|nr:hypothetical protein [Planctomycetota bacterium]MBL7043192.1 hypothetical protein [Pirellulaceae bacterium]
MIDIVREELVIDTESGRAGEPGDEAPFRIVHSQIGKANRYPLIQK